jgi:hypothetical protein
MNNIIRKEAQKRFYLTFRNLSIQRFEMIKMKKTIIAAILLTVIAVTGLNFAGAFASTGSSVVSPTPKTCPIVSVPPACIIPIRSSWVRIDGNITSWGTQVAPVVKGTLTVMAATTSRNGVPAAWFDSATAIWTNTTKISSDGNISYSYYAARLVKANFTAANFQGNDFFMSGNWSVVNVTITRTVIKTDDSINIQSNTLITRLETKVYGELNVTGSLTQFPLSFTLSIKGIPLLDGTVHRSIERQMMFNRFDIVNAGTDSTVTQADLTTIENSYGAVPGMPNYDENMDFQGTYQIGICDIATIAANVQP